MTHKKVRKEELCNISSGYGPGKRVKPIYSGIDVQDKNGTGREVQDEYGLRK